MSKIPTKDGYYWAKDKVIFDSEWEPIQFFNGKIRLFEDDYSYDVREFEWGEEITPPVEDQK